MNFYYFKVKTDDIAKLYADMLYNDLKIIDD
jgi:hypothetical protein